MLLEDVDIAAERLLHGLAASSPCDAQNALDCVDRVVGWNSRQSGDLKMVEYSVSSRPPANRLTHFRPPRRRTPLWAIAELSDVPEH